MSLRSSGLVAVLVVTGCSGTPARGGAASAEADGAQCTAAAEFEHPSYESDAITLDFGYRGDREGMVIPPFQFEVSVAEPLTAPVSMELIIYDPTGVTTVQRFSHHNTREQCDPYCLPAAGARCGPRSCRMVSHRPGPERIDPEVYRSATPGRWTFVVHRLDNDDRVSVVQRLFEGEGLDGEACEAIPLALGDYRRVDCRRGIVPMGTSTHYWGLKARYTNGSCRANVFALPLSDGIRAVFEPGPYNAAPERVLPEGTVHEVRLEGGLGRAWLAHHHFYLLAAPDGLPGYDELTGALLRVFPVVGGPVRPLPTCDGTGTVDERTVDPVIVADLGGFDARFNTHFEGNRASGVRATFPDAHPLTALGMRSREIVYAVDGHRVHNRRELAAALEVMSRVGPVEIIVGRARVRHPRCLRLTIEEPLAVFDEADGDRDGDGDGGHAGDAVAVPTAPPPPTRGRHCERRSSRCWACVEFALPAEVGCAETCPRRGLCVTTAGQRRCLEPVRVCCAEGQRCDTPPGCEGVASSCAGDFPGGPANRCTFLNDCAEPLPGG